MGDTFIGDLPPSDGRDWDLQCARCGSSVVREDCESCDGEGRFDAYEEDPINCDPGDEEPCRACGGSGSFRVCVSSPEWCEANSLPGRIHQRGVIEWFVKRSLSNVVATKQERTTMADTIDEEARADVRHPAWASVDRLTGEVAALRQTVFDLEARLATVRAEQNEVAQEHLRHLDGSDVASLRAEVQCRLDVAFEQGAEIARLKAQLAARPSLKASDAEQRLRLVGDVVAMLVKEGK